MEIEKLKDLKGLMRYNNPDNEIQIKIDNYFKQLEIFINKLPLTEKGKKFIWFDSFIKFYDTIQITENGSFTYGIQTKWQVNKFSEQFKNNIQKLRLKHFEVYSKELDNLPPLVAKDKLNKELIPIKRKEILTKIGGEKLTDWESFVKEYLSNELENIGKLKNEKEQSEIIIIKKNKGKGQPKKPVNNNLYYIKHKSLFDLHYAGYSKNILDYYEKMEYKYIEIKDYGEIPIPYCRLLSIDELFNYENLPFSYYAKGFLIGYNEPLKPIVDTVENWKQLISIAIGDGLKSFCEHMGVPIEQRYKSEDFFQDGLTEGKRYKAWSIIFENPEVFKSEEINKVEKSEKENEQSTEGKTKDFIITEIVNTDTEKGWQYVFKNETDYNTFVDLLTNYFEYKPNSLPDKIIELRRGCKTKFSTTLGNIVRELSNKDKIKDETEYFKIIKILNHYNKMKDNEIYKAITRN